MRKSGWAAATGLGSLVLLLAACGGSSGSNSAAGGASSLPSASSGSSAPATAASSATAASTASSGGATATSKAKAKKARPHHSVGPQPSSGGGEQSIPPVGTTVMVVQKSAIGYVMAVANHQVVYTYDKDKKGQPPTCTGTCAQTWRPVTGTPQAGPADHFPGQFGLVKTASGTEQVTYEGLPLYVLAGAKPLLTTGNGQGGVWHVIKLSASDVG